ncbi:hypothetical protein B0J17DRAFT_719279 [Rhizoctonia solani]|nr:hypothetical protein B0J17DRAFT_719279 [Rhizoctonia solani]
MDGDYINPMLLLMLRAQSVENSPPIRSTDYALQITNWARDNMTITLKCRHTFTLEALGGITHLGDFYAQDSQGKWVQAITPGTHGENRVRPATKARETLETLLRKQPGLPTPSKPPEQLAEYHGMPSSYTKLWKGVEKKLLQAYRQAQQATTHCDSSIQALFEEELGYFAAYPTRTPGNVEQRALQLARMRIGQSPPRASLRFAVAGFWVMICILILLAEAANQASKPIQSRGVESIVNYLADGSGSWNKAAKCQVIAMQAEYELASHKCRTIIEYRWLTAEIKSDLARMCVEGIEVAQILRAKVSRVYVNRGANDPQSRMQWIQDSFLTPITQLLDSWKRLKQAVEYGAWYPTLTKDEGREVMHA